MKKGELGASWSHILLYEKLLNDEEYDCYMIMEDDAQFLRELDRFVKAIKSLPEFDIVHMAKSDWYPFLNDKKINEEFYKHQKRYFNRLTSYLISKSGAKKTTTKDTEFY
jgi:GR25 family glycosyltransferase involved in LPS biosynthesis